MNINEYLKDEKYGLEGEFCVTITTNDNRCVLGEVTKSNKIELSKAGLAAQKYWHQIEEHFANVTLKEYVIMPNHIHGIIEINPNQKKKENYIIHDVSRFEICFGLMVGRNNPFMLKGSIFHLITWFKAASLIEIKRQYNDEFAWKSGYFDFQIKNPASSKSIKNYIETAANRWPLTMENPEESLRDFIHSDPH
ncbi:MAG: hypothetical protein ACK40G_07550 [Cytophagaceae bacterium]